VWVKNKGEKEERNDPLSRCLTSAPRRGRRRGGEGGRNAKFKAFRFRCAIPAAGKKKKEKEKAGGKKKENRPPRFVPLLLAGGGKNLQKGGTRRGGEKEKRESPASTSLLLPSCSSFSSARVKEEGDYGADSSFIPQISRRGGGKLQRRGPEEREKGERAEGIRYFLFFFYVIPALQGKRFEKGKTDPPLTTHPFLLLPSLYSIIGGK